MFFDPVSRLYFEKWLAQRAEQFYAAVYRRWGDDGLDALQDCLTKICQGRVGNAKFTSIVDVEKWLWKCIYFRVIDIRRREQGQQGLGVHDPDASPDPPLPLHLRWLQPIVCACYRALNDYRKEVLRRYYLYSQLVEEIAKEMQRKMEAVKAVLHQARRQLRECLEQNRISYEDLVDVMLYLAVFDCENDPRAEDRP